MLLEPFYCNSLFLEEMHKSVSGKLEAGTNVKKKKREALHTLSSSCSRQQLSTSPLSCSFVDDASSLTCCSSLRSSDAAGCTSAGEA